MQYKKLYQLYIKFFLSYTIAFLKESIVFEFIADCGNLFKSLIVRGKKSYNNLVHSRTGDVQEKE